MLKKKRNIVWFLMLGAFICARAQTITPQVINSAGDHRPLGTTGIFITDNVGEPFTETLGSAGNVFVTQGFIQPNVVSFGGFTSSVIYQSPSCLDRNDDAFIAVSLITPVKSYTPSYYWTPSTVCPGNNCATVDTLSPGIYSVMVVINYTNALGSMVRDTLKQAPVTIVKATVPCKVKIYSGITANNDGFNDKWIIDNIEEYPNNRVTVYSRWGRQLYDTKGYNNIDKSWPNTAQLDFLDSSTYFYVVELGDGSPPIKGWVELIKNQ